jgi:hypothetical protein
MAQNAWAEIDVGNEVNSEELPKEEMLQYTEMCTIEQHCVSQSWILGCPTSSALSCGEAEGKSGPNDQRSGLGS